MKINNYKNSNTVFNAKLQLKSDIELPKDLVDKILVKSENIGTNKDIIDIDINKTFTNVTSWYTYRDINIASYINGELKQYKRTIPNYISTQKNIKELKKSLNKFFKTITGSND